MKVKLDGHTIGISPATAYLEHVELNYGSHMVDLLRFSIMQKYYLFGFRDKLLIALVEDETAEKLGMEETDRITCKTHYVFWCVLSDCA